MAINLTTQEGRLTRDPEVRYTAKGKAVCNFDIAQNKRWKDSSGEEKEKVNFFSCKAFGPVAEIIAKYMKKGSWAVFEGELDQERWEKDGQKHQREKILVQKIHFGPKAKKDDDKESPQEAPERAAEPDMDNDDIPF